MLHTIFALSLTIFFSIRIETHTQSQFDHKKEFLSHEKEAYKKYFEQQEKIYKEFLEKGISGVRPLIVDEALAEEIVANCPKEVEEVVSDIEQSVFCVNKKNAILHGKSGTGKSCLAQAIAIKTQTPCLFFNTGGISTEYANSGIQNLDRIFQYAKTLEKESGKPCIVIFDELEALTRKHTDKNNHENNILISFWQQLDNLSNSKVVVIGTMNGTDDVPVQITNRTSMIEVPLPSLEQRDAIVSYYLKTKKDKSQLIYPESISGIAAYIARQTEGFSNRDLQNLVEQTTKPLIKAPAMLDKSNKVVMGNYFDSAIKQIKKDPKRRLEREIGTWKHTFKTSLRDPKALGVAAIVASVFVIYNQRQAMKQAKESTDKQSVFQEQSYALNLKSFELQQQAQIFQKQTLELQKDGQSSQKEALDLQKQALDLQRQSIILQIANQKENIDNQKEAMKQVKEIADKQMSDEQIARNGSINLSVLGIPVGVPYYYLNKWWHSSETK
jgi:SpoVK/Ycf46/Vps4 family AAA+-type ATPase